MLRLLCDSVARRSAAGHLISTSFSSVSACAPASARRCFHAASILRQDGPADDGGGDGDDGVGGDGARIPLEEMRRGRPYLDPRAPRRLDHIRNDPMHDKYKGLVDILEHAAYCDGQREEHPEGFFFDNTRPAYDSDCDGDPFAASYLTEDEIEFPEEYAPSPYIPGRVMDAMWYLYTVKGWPIARIADKYALQTARVSAILNLKATEGQMKATGRYDERLDQQMDALYANQFGTSMDKTLPEAGGMGTDGLGHVNKMVGREGWDPSLDMGVKYSLIQDEEDDRVEFPFKRDGEGQEYRGHELRLAPGLPKRQPLPRKERTYKSKYIFLDVSSERRRTRNSRRANPLLTSDYDGTVRLASNVETLYRSWEPRRWSIRLARDPLTAYPYLDKDANKAADFKLKP